MNAYFAYTIVDFKGQSNPVKKVMFAVAIEGVIFIVMSSLDIRRMIFKIFPAWMMKATMAGMGLFLAFIGLQSGKGSDINRDHPAVLVDRKELRPNQLRKSQLRKMQYQLRKQNIIATNFAMTNSFTKRAQELEKYCAELIKINRRQKAKVHSKFRNVQLAKVHNKLRNEHENENENEKNNELEKHKENEKHNELEKNNEIEKNLENKIFKKKLVPLLPDRHFASAASFQLFGYKAWKEFREASLEILFSKTTRDKELRHQLRRAQLDYKTFWSGSFKALCLSSFDDNSFADSSFTEESFKEGSFDDSSLEEETFSNNSLGEETFYDSSLEDSSFQDSSFEESSFAENSFEESSFAANSFEESSFAENSFEESSFAENSFEESSFAANSFEESSFAENSFEESSFAENSFEESSFAENSFEESSLEENSFEKRRFSESSFEENRFQDSSFQRRTSTPELSQLPRQALPTELAQLQRNGLTKAASSFELTTAQLCAKEASFSILSGASFFTSRRRGGVLNSKACLPQLVPYQLDSWANLAQASPSYPKGACSLASYQIRKNISRN